MRTPSLRLLLALVATVLAAMGFAATITVTSPTSGDFLGKNNTLSFNIKDATSRVNVTATFTPTGGGTPITFGTIDPIIPNADGSKSGSLEINFNDAVAEGAYTLKVTTSSTDSYNTVADIPVTIDVVAPRFEELSPVTGGFTKGIVKIRASFEEANIKNWRVQVNNQDIPNGTGNSNTVAVSYDPANLVSDTSLSITITATDRANNTATKTISLTLDRVRPTVQIVYPATSTRLNKGQDVTVLIDVTDASTNSVDKTGIDVIAKRPDGSYITRVTLVSFKGTSNTVQRWTGRIRYVKGQLPSRFVLSVSVIDKAGNVATLQEVTVRYGN